MASAIPAVGRTLGIPLLRNLFSRGGQTVVRELGDDAVRAGLNMAPSMANAGKTLVTETAGEAAETVAKRSFGSYFNPKNIWQDFKDTFGSIRQVPWNKGLGGVYRHVFNKQNFSKTWDTLIGPNKFFMGINFGLPMLMAIPQAWNAFSTAPDPGTGFRRSTGILARALGIGALGTVAGVGAATLFPVQKGIPAAALQVFLNMKAMNMADWINDPMGYYQPGAQPPTTLPGATSPVATAPGATAAAMPPDLQVAVSELAALPAEQRQQFLQQSVAQGLLTQEQAGQFFQLASAQQPQANLNFAGTMPTNPQTPAYPAAQTGVVDQAQSASTVPITTAQTSGATATQAAPAAPTPVYLTQAYPYTGYPYPVASTGTYPTSVTPHPNTMYYRQSVPSTTAPNIPADPAAQDALLNQLLSAQGMAPLPDVNTVLAQLGIAGIS